MVGTTFREPGIINLENAVLDGGLVVVIQSFFLTVTDVPLQLLVGGGSLTFVNHSGQLQGLADVGGHDGFVLIGRPGDLNGGHGVAQIDGGLDGDGLALACNLAGDADGSLAGIAGEHDVTIFNLRELGRGDGNIGSFKVNRFAASQDAHRDRVHGDGFALHIHIVGAGNRFTAHGDVGLVLGQDGDGDNSYVPRAVNDHGLHLGCLFYILGGEHAGLGVDLSGVVLHCDAIIEVINPLIVFNIHTLLKQIPLELLDGGFGFMPVIFPILPCVLGGSGQLYGLTGGDRAVQFAVCSGVIDLHEGSGHSDMNRGSRLLLAQRGGDGSGAVLVEVQGIGVVCILFGGTLYRELRVLCQFQIAVGIHQRRYNRISRTGHSPRFSESPVGSDLIAIIQVAGGNDQRSAAFRDGDIDHNMIDRTTPAFFTPVLVTVSAQQQLGVLRNPAEGQLAIFDGGCIIVVALIVVCSIDINPRVDFSVFVLVYVFAIIIYVIDIVDLPKLNYFPVEIGLGDLQGCIIVIVGLDGEGHWLRVGRNRLGNSDVYYASIAIEFNGSGILGAGAVGGGGCEGQLSGGLGGHNKGVSEQVFIVALGKVFLGRLNLRYLAADADLPVDLGYQRIGLIAFGKEDEGTFANIISPGPFFVSVDGAFLSHFIRRSILTYVIFNAHNAYPEGLHRGLNQHGQFSGDRINTINTGSQGSAHSNHAVLGGDTGVGGQDTLVSVDGGNGAPVLAIGRRALGSDRVQRAGGACCVLAAHNVPGDFSGGILGKVGGQGQLLTGGQKTAFIAFFIVVFSGGGRVLDIEALGHLDHVDGQGGGNALQVAAGDGNGGCTGLTGGGVGEGAGCLVDGALQQLSAGLRPLHVAQRAAVTGLHRQSEALLTVKVQGVLSNCFAEIVHRELNAGQGAVNVHLNSYGFGAFFRCGNENLSEGRSLENRKVLRDNQKGAILNHGGGAITSIQLEGVAGQALNLGQIPFFTDSHFYDGGFLRTLRGHFVLHSLLQKQGLFLENWGGGFLGGLGDGLLSSLGDSLLGGLGDGLLNGCGDSLLNGCGDGLLGGFGDGLLSGLWDGLLGGFGDGHLCGLVLRRDAFCRFQQGGGFVRFFRQCLERHHGHNHCHGQQKGQQSLFHAWFLLFMEIDSVSLGQWGNRVAGYSFQQLKYKICPQQIQQQIVTFTT